MSTDRIPGADDANRDYYEQDPAQAPPPDDSPATPPAAAPQRGAYTATRAKTDARSCTTALLQRCIPHTPPNDVGACVRGFLALPAAASITVLVSAACLLGGLWGVLAPTIGDAALLNGRFAAAGSLAAYLAALFACVWLLLRWQRGNHDAIGPAVVAAAFLPGLGITIDLVAADQPAGGGLLAAGGTVLGLLLWHGWRQATQRGLPIPPGERIPAAMLLLLGWNMAWPVLLGGLRAAEAAALAATHAWSGPHAFSLWLPGWIGGLAAGGLLLHAAACGPSPWRDGNQPFILRPAMRWVLALTLFLASMLHQWSLAHASGLDLTPADGLAPFALLALILNELCARAAPHDVQRERWLMIVLAALGLWLGIDAAGQPISDDDDLPRWVHLVMRELLAPAPTLALIAGAAIALGWRRGSSALHWSSVWPLFVAVLVWHAGPGATGLNWLAGALYGGFMLGGWAYRRRNLTAGWWAIAIAEAVVIQLPPVHDALRHAELMPPLVWLAAYAATLSSIAMACPRLLSVRLRRYAAWSLMLGGASCLDPQYGLQLKILGGSLLVAVMAGTSWRTRDWLVALPLALPAGVLAVRWSPDNKAWLAVWAAFPLLGATLALSRRRLKEGINQP